jgi:hypothetical protein
MTVQVSEVVHLKLMNVVSVVVTASMKVHVIAKEMS